MVIFVGDDAAQVGRHTANIMNMSAVMTVALRRITTVYIKYIECLLADSAGLNRGLAVGPMKSIHEVF